MNALKTALTTVLLVQLQLAIAEDSAAPQETLIEEIVITAEKRAESIQTVPLAISAYSGEVMAERRILEMKDLAHLNPSVRVPVSDPNDVRITIRGIGSFGGFEPAVALVVDGVAQSSTRGGFNFSLFDVERVEVLRGPQGTIGGRNSTAGGIYITSKRPTETMEGYVKATLGNYRRRAVEGAVGGPVFGDKLLARVAIKTDNANGWIQNTITPGNDRMNLDNQQVRVSLEAHPTDNFSALLTLEDMRNRQRGGNYFCGRARPDTPSFGELNGLDCPSSPTVAQDEPNIRDEKFQQAALRLEWNLQDSMRLTSITGYYEKNLFWAYDLDETPVNIGIFAPPVDQRLEQRTQEFTFTGEVGERFDYVFGALYMRNRLAETEGVVFLPFIPADNALLLSGQEGTTSWSGYGQLRYRLTDQIRVTAGTRYLHDSKFIDTSESGFNTARGTQARSWTAWTPRVSVDWQPNDRLMAYATVARGFKSGGFDEGAIPSRSFNPEYVTNYEVGMKTQPTNRLKADLTLFYMDYTNLQNRVGTFDPDVGNVFRTINAATAKIKGAELNLVAQPLDELRLTAAVTYLDTEYGDFHATDELYPELGTFDPQLNLNVRDLTGNRLLGAPKWQWVATGDYTLRVGNKLEAVLKASYTWNGKAFSSIYNNPGIEGDEVGLIDVSISLRNTQGNWQATAFVQNLSNERYFLDTRGGPPNFWRTGIPGSPRWYGVEVEYRF